MNQPASAAPKLKKEDCEGLTREQLVELLLVALEAQRATNENTVNMAKLVEEASKRVKELDDKLASQEAELIALRNRP